VKIEMAKAGEDVEVVGNTEWWDSRVPVL
jgi:hypothetical protein